MRAFSVKGIRVELAKTGYAILMHLVHYADHMADDFNVVYADPTRLSPFMDAILAKHPVWYGPDGLKRADARIGLLQAKTEVTERMSILTLEGNPLPMPYAGAFVFREMVNRGFFRRPALREIPKMGFTNGVTRTLELLAHEAEFIPLETHKKESALLHSLVGGDRPPECVRNFTVPPSVRMEQMRLHYGRQRACNALNSK